METKKEKTQLNDYEIEFIINVLAQDKTNLQCVLNNEELDYVLQFHNKVINKLHNIIMVSKEERLQKRMNNK